jgi:hypothetical protein
VLIEPKRDDFALRDKPVESVLDYFELESL